MKKMMLITVPVALIAAVLAVSAYAWTYRGSTYICSPANRTAVFCRETNWSPAYQVAIFPGYITVSFGGEVIFGCKRGITPAGNCEYLGP
jgi:hypothetical protein